MHARSKVSYAAEKLCGHAGIPVVRTCEKTREYSYRIAVRNVRDRRDERDARIRGLKFEVFRIPNPELQSSDHAFLACRALHAPRTVALARFPGNLLVCRSLDGSYELALEWLGGKNHCEEIFALGAQGRRLA